MWPPFLKAKVVPIWRRPIYSRVNDEGSRSHTRFAECSYSVPIITETDSKCENDNLDMNC